MGIFDGLKKVFTSGPSAEQPQQNIAVFDSELRMHARYSVNMAKLIEISLLPAGTPAYVCDLSYGGALVEFDQNGNTDVQHMLDHYFDIKIKHLGRSCKGRAKVVHMQSDRKRIGLSFEHTSVDLLVFLRGILEFMRLGASMIAINRSLTRVNTGESDTLLYRGDAPTDLQYKRSNGAIVDLILSYRQGDELFELRYTPQNISASKSQYSENNSLKQQPTSIVPEEEIIRDAICVIIGFNAVNNDPTIDKLISELLTKFQS